MVQIRTTTYTKNSVMFYSRNGYCFYCLSGDEAGAGDLGEGWHIPEHQDPHQPPYGQHGGRAEEG